MKAITKIEEKVIGWEAWDGTQFSSNDECEKYEESAFSVLKQSFMEHVVNKDNIQNGEVFYSVLSPCIDDNFYLVDISNQNVLLQINQLLSMCKSTLIPNKYIGEKIVICVYNNDFGCSDIYGTIDEWKRKVMDCIDSMFETNEEDK